jgi:hypothetical protein
LGYNILSHLTGSSKESKSSAPAMMPSQGSSVYSSDMTSHKMSEQTLERKSSVQPTSRNISSRISSSREKLTKSDNLVDSEASHRKDRSKSSSVMKKKEDSRKHSVSARELNKEEEKSSFSNFDIPSTSASSVLQIVPTSNTAEYPTPPSMHFPPPMHFAPPAMAMPPPAMASPSPSESNLSQDMPRSPTERARPSISPTTQPTPPTAKAAAFPAKSSTGPPPPGGLSSTLNTAAPVRLPPPTSSLLKQKIKSLSSVKF